MKVRIGEEKEAATRSTSVICRIGCQMPILKPMKYPKLQRQFYENTFTTT